MPYYSLDIAIKAQEVKQNLISKLCNCRVGKTYPVFKHTFRVIPAEEVNRERSSAYKYLV